MIFKFVSFFCFVLNYKYRGPVLTILIGQLEQHLKRKSYDIQAWPNSTHFRTICHVHADEALKCQFNSLIIYTTTLLHNHPML